MNILLFVIGNSSVLHLQAHYALRTLHVHSQKDDKLYILTDAPVLYKKLPFVEVIEITEQEIKDWYKGYFFRIKINAIRKFAELHDNGHLLFVDCDTYCFNNLSPIKNLLDNDYGVMHKDEGSMETMKGDSGVMWNQTKGRMFADVTITNAFHMWNSGVVGIPRGQVANVMNKSLALCDALLNEGVTCFNLEQWSVSIALQEYTKGIKETHELIGHYWHHKYVWTRYIAVFFADSYAHGGNLEKELHVIKKTNHKRLSARLALQRALMKVFCKNH
mgnify:CR=1 FL=1